MLRLYADDLAEDPRNRLPMTLIRIPLETHECDRTINFPSQVYKRRPLRFEICIEACKICRVVPATFKRITDGFRRPQPTLMTIVYIERWKTERKRCLRETRLPRQGHLTNVDKNIDIRSFEGSN